MSAASGQLPRIVVLGAGFAGLTFCRRFPAGRARITVIDRQNHHLFQPLLYQVATAGLAAVDISQPIRALLRDYPDLDVLMSDVQAIDLGRRVVRHQFGETGYDYLVIGLGGRTSYFGHPEWERFAPGLKTLDDALDIRRRVLLAFERAEVESDETRKRELTTTVVVGGGPTGVEMAGTLAELSRRVLRRDFDHIDPTRARVILIEGGDRVLGNFPPDLSERALEQLQRLGVEVRVGIRVQDIRANEVKLPNGEIIRAGIIIWAAGVGAVELTRSLGVPTDRAGRIQVQPDLSLPGNPEAFAAGDIVSLTDAAGIVVPGVAQGAIQGAAHIARLIATEIEEGPSVSRPAFVYVDKGNMATIGRSAAVAQIGRLHFSGYPAWVAWLGLHLIFLIGLRNRIAVLLQWIYSYCTYRRGARLITGNQGSPPAGSA